MIFIAGATGFVGGHLVGDLIAKGHKVKCLVRSEKAAASLAARGVEVIRGDITSPESLKGVLHADDFVIHLVGIIEERRIWSMRQKGQGSDISSINPHWASTGIPGPDI
jgi:uncharacterized protein YbjT (DUF2867 family)